MSEETDEQTPADPLAPQDLPPADQIMADIKKFDPEFLKDRPRDRMMDYALNRMAIIQSRQRSEGSAMMSGWRREWLMMNDVRAFIEWFEQRELERKVKEDGQKKWKNNR